jgi:hypothetical protein
MFRSPLPTFALLVLALAGGCASPHALRAPGPSETRYLVDPSDSLGVIEGQVTDSEGQGIRAPTVVLEQTRVGALGDDSGHFSLTAVRPGQYVLRAMVLGYRPVRLPVTVRAGQATTVKVDIGPLRRDVKTLR